MQELIEPLPTNDRGVVFPLTRSWTSDSGAIARIDFTREHLQASSHAYAIRSASGDLLERGTATVSRHGTLSTSDLAAPGRPSRLGVFDIVNRTMRLALGAPGAPRPTSVADAAL